jgi:hypothetical protein
MANSPVDRDINYMKEMWGTTRLITDYTTNPTNIKRDLQEITYDLAPTHKNQEVVDLIEDEEWNYGVEPEYKNKKVIRM